MNESNSELLAAILWDTPTTAKNLNCSERTLYDRTEPRGPLKCVRFESRVMYRPSDIKAYLDELRANPIQPKIREGPIVPKPKSKRGGRRTPKKETQNS